ncbi:hypothetical protein QL093DRAFT_2017762 [Fusarium oxysporum]|nr:hypothetical protein QL093DRAFT_2017762 [Fusarium oxysporum]
MAGFLIPPWYKTETPKDLEMNIVSLIFGFSMGASMFTAGMAIKQTMQAYQRKRLFSAYIIMCWLDWIGCNCMGIITYCWLRGFAPPSFWVFFFIIVFWSMQIQFTLQIIINRISLLLGNKTNINRVKWGVAVVASLINISGFCIWVPARLQISHLYEEINIVWDRTEKAVFLIVDLSLNLYFIYLVRSRLIACGLTKYTELFHFNVIMVVISVSLDCVLMGATFLPSPVVYVQFHQLVYLLKLYIEMNVASLLGHIVKSSREQDARPTEGGRQRVRDELVSGRMTTFVTASRTGHVRLDDMSRDDSYRRTSDWENGIVKKVETKVVFTETQDQASTSDQERMITMSKYTRPSTFVGFSALSNRVFVRPGETRTGIEPNPEHPRTIVIYGWGDAPPRHISKFTDVYRQLYPHAKQVAVLSPIYKGFIDHVAQRTEAMLPVIHEVFPNNAPDGSVLFHVMSNSGTINYSATLNAYKETYNRPMPHALTVYDSTPGTPYLTWDNLKRFSHAMAIGLAAKLPLPFIVTQVLCAWFFCMIHVFDYLAGRESAPKFSHRIFTDEQWESKKSTRLFLYGKGDFLIPWQHIEGYMAVSQEAGYPSEGQLFESGHVGHMKKNPEKYWGTIQESWERAVGRYYEASNKPRERTVGPRQV